MTRERCGQPHYRYTESACTEPAGHYRRDIDSHTGPLIIDGRQCGAVAWDEPENPTMTDRISLDDMTSDQLDQLYAECDRLTAELADYDVRAEQQKQRAERAEAANTRVTSLYEQWVKAGPPPLGVPLARWWDRRLVELHEAIHPAAEQPARTTAETPAATEATDTWKEPTHPHPCTATIEGRATPAGRQVQCTREARHPENHVGPKQGANGRVLWTDHQAGATPHKETP